MKAIGICLLPLLLTGSDAVLTGDEGIVERKKVRKVIVECEGNDCDRQVYVPAPDVGPAFDADELCAGLEECEVRIECADEDDCTCEVNGAAVECP